MGEIIDIAKFERLINGSKLSGPYKSLIMKDIIYAINAKKGVGFNFVNDGSFLKAVETISNSSITDNMKYSNIFSLVSCLKNEDVSSGLQNKLNIVLYAMLTSHGVIHTYPASEIPHVPCIKRPNGKRSDMIMSDYLLDDQVIREDLLWLKNKDLRRFKELCGDINKTQDKEAKETFENYLNQINFEEKRNTLKHTADALATICVVTGVIAIIGKSAVVGVIAAIAGIMLGGCLLCSSKLECVNVTRESKECATPNSKFFVDL